MAEVRDTTLCIKGALTGVGAPVVLWNLDGETTLLTPEQAEWAADKLRRAASESRNTAQLVAERPGALATFLANASGGHA